MTADDAGDFGAEDTDDGAISVVTLGEDAADEESPVAGPDETEGEGIAGTFSPAEEIEPGQIDPENAAFVLLGALLTILVFVRMFAFL